jgi:hypothetical protein
MVFHPLTKDEIDRRIDSLAQTLAPDDEPGSARTDLRPRWISAAELIRRVRPYIAMN